MKAALRSILCIAALALESAAIASDHADPMSLNAFFLQEEPLANITDLHAFVVDKTGKRLPIDGDLSQGHALVVSTCVRRKLLPTQTNDPALDRDLPTIVFRLHIDLDAPVKHYDPNKLADGRDYRAALLALDEEVTDAKEARDAEVANAKAARDAAKHSDSAPQATAKDDKSPEQKELEVVLGRRGQFLADHQLALRMDDLYGGTIESPELIAEDVTFDFRLKLERNDNDVKIVVTTLEIDGLGGTINNLSRASADFGKASPPSKAAAPAWKPDTINVQAGIFDDPFIFPRFFRGNVIGIVTSIPLELLRRPDGTRASNGTILLWATTHDKRGKQSDHVGRSLRTQLPRFGYLNPLHPAQHVAAIMRHHGNPTLMENTLATFLAPLEAHRYYDLAPDVMIYALKKPAKFPNGRRLEDDVSKTLADAGETLLYEISLSESRQYPRATTNDKPFDDVFPYLPPPWTSDELNDHGAPEPTLADQPDDKKKQAFVVPFPPDKDATRLPDFSSDVWKSVWWGLLIAIVVTSGLAFWALPSVPLRVLIVLIAVVTICGINPVIAKALDATDPGATRQPLQRLNRTMFGWGIATLMGLVALYGAGIRHGRRRALRPPDDPTLEDEGLNPEFDEYDGSTYKDVYDAVFKEPYFRGAWSADQLPVYYVPLSTLAKGIWPWSESYPFREASRRSVSSKADLRWGKDNKGVPRLLHPHGVCLAGTWRITQETSYTGLFATGTSCLIIARYSSEERLQGRPRTLSLVGKLFPTMYAEQKVETASFITQSALGGLKVASIFDAKLLNAPEIHPFASLQGFLRLALTLLAFRTVDSHKTERQLYEVAEAGKDPKQPLKCPRFMRLLPKRESQISDNMTDDFRGDVLSQLYHRDGTKRETTLDYTIEVSDKGRMTGWINRTLHKTEWREIGVIEFKEAVVSHNGDFVIHFHHPKWRDDGRSKPRSCLRSILWCASAFSAKVRHWLG